MKEINSTENRIYKLCSKLAMKKHRDDLGKYIIEGPNLIAEALAENASLDFLLFRKGCRLGPLQADYGGDTYLLEEKLFEKLAQTENSQGVLAVVKKIELTADQFFGHCGAGSGNVAVLDRLQDPGNIGTIIRTADAAGYRGVMLLKGTADVYSPKVVRSAAGSLFRVPLLFTDTPKEAAALLKDNGKRLVSTCFDTELTYYEADLRRNIALIIGNEGNGISKELMELSHCKLKIPMYGKIDSLNAAVAAGILMYESVRK